MGGSLKASEIAEGLVALFVISSFTLGAIWLGWEITRARPFPRPDLVVEPDEPLSTCNHFPGCPEEVTLEEEK